MNTVSGPEYSLDDLLAKVNKRNIQKEIDPGIAVGKEFGLESKEGRVDI